MESVGNIQKGLTKTETEFKMMVRMYSHQKSERV